MEDVWRDSLMKTLHRQHSIRETMVVMPSVSSADASWRLNVSASLLSICLLFHFIPVSWKLEYYSVEIPNYLRGTWNSDMLISDRKCPHIIVIKFHSCVEIANPNNAV